MEYEEFMKEMKRGRLRAGISDSVAIGLVSRLPREYQFAGAFWSWIWMLSIPGFICVSIFYSWWVGLLLLLFVTPAISSATKKSASQHVLECIQNDPKLYDELMDAGVIELERVRRTRK